MSEKKRQPDETQIAKYLAGHPDFFERHPEVIEQLNLSSEGVVGNVAILAEKQTRMLQTRHHKLETNFKTVVKNATENERRSICLHRLAMHLTMHEYSGRSHVVESALVVLREELPMNIINIISCDDSQDDDAKTGVRDPRLRGLVESLFAANKPDCGPFDAAVKTALFGKLAKRIASAVIMPLFRPRDADSSHIERFGVLGFGNTSADSFKVGMGTMFLVQCAELIAATLARYDS